MCALTCMTQTMFGAMSQWMAIGSECAKVGQVRAIDWAGPNTNWIMKFSHVDMPLLEALWWRFMPGVTVVVKWPRGHVRVGPAHPQGWSGYGEYYDTVWSADPNDHYRAWLENNVGRQGWDWNWRMLDNDVANNCIHIKVRQKFAMYATIMAINWS